MKYIYIVCLLLVSCTTSSLKVEEDSHTEAAKLSIPLKGSYLNLCLELYNTKSDLYGYLVSKDYRLESEDRQAEITVCIESFKFSDRCLVFNGDQKALLSDQLLDKILYGLKEKNRIHIEIEGEIAIIETDGLDNKIDHLRNNLPFYQKLVGKGLEYLDANNYQ